MSRRVVGPFNRVEGDLEVQLEINDGQVTDAWVVSPLYRGFEQILQGKAPLDALIYTPRICGICSVSQSVAAAQALADAQNLQPAPQGQVAINLILANENVADHLTHFYLFFMPDFAREIYQHECWFPEIEKRFKAVTGTAASDVLPARSDFLHLMGILAGKWPHSLAIQPGGTTRSIAVQEKSRIQAIIYNFRRFLERTLYGDSLESIVALSSVSELDNWLEQSSGTSDFQLFLRVSQAMDLASMGRANSSFMSYGAYRSDDGAFFPQGIWSSELKALDSDKIMEDVSHSWMNRQPDGARHPWQGVTHPDPDASEGYTWCKAPRLDGRVMEVGALARQVVDGHPLIRELAVQSGGNVRNRVIARLLELARVVIQMETWAGEIQPKSVFCHQPEHADWADKARGFGMVEAARGSLGHWVSFKNGRIDNYQIIAPTTWNFSPRDADGIPGALEQALIGAPVREGEKDPVAVQHIVRSFDPCMVCTVH